MDVGFKFCCHHSFLRLGVESTVNGVILRCRWRACYRSNTRERNAAFKRFVENKLTTLKTSQQQTRTMTGDVVWGVSERDWSRADAVFTLTKHHDNELSFPWLRDRRVTLFQRQQRKLTPKEKTSIKYACDLEPRKGHVKCSLCFLSDNSSWLSLHNLLSTVCSSHVRE